ncbi:sensor histidine kinase [Mariniradius sediminis]|uniref:histidine kinase n=1 Tax=Mariniradius sediminis TaxID=2909237 RepID=A0ABS9BYC5_9BACT|nr:tetratricopeptide repeat protein [Mariniradius sediminis]MCF1752699.1 tetratricopeptide repeat-containing sensor histidine kinase [Mariniradius sediminis]
MPLNHPKKTASIAAWIILSCFLGIYQTAFGQSNKAQELYQQYLQTKDLRQKLTIVSDLAWEVHLSDSSRKYYEEAIELAKLLENPELQAQNLNRLGIAYRNIELQEESLKMYEEALKVAKSSGNHKEEAFALNNIAQIHYYQESYEDAMTYYEEAKDIFLKINNLDGLGYTYTGMSVVQTKIKNYQEALALINQAIEIREKLADVRQIFISKMNRGRIYQQMGDLELAERDLSQFMEYSLENDKRGAIYVLGELGNVYFKKKNLRKAEEVAAKAIEINEEIPASEAMITAYGLLYQIANFKGDTDAAKQYLDKLDEARQTFTEEKTKLYLSGIMVRKQREEIASLNREKELMEANQRFKSYVLYALLLMAFSFFLAFSVYYRSFKKEKASSKMLKTKQEEIEAQTAELDKLNQEKDKIFSILAHDLKAPMDSLWAMVNLLNEQNLTKEEFEAYLPILSQSIGNNSILLENVLVWSRSQMNGIRAEISSCNLYTLVESNINFFKTSQFYKGQNLQNFIPKNLEVEADRNMLDIVFRNLLTNALKFTDNGDMISISAEDSGRFYTISIADQGTGIPEANLEKLFGNQFFSTRGTHREKGSGLGLLLSKELIQKNKGDIWVESQIGYGSTFSFTLPKP